MDKPAAKACSTCAFYHGAKALPDGVPVPAHYHTGGQCHRYPTPLRKNPDGYWCGEWAPVVPPEKEAKA